MIKRQTDEFLQCNPVSGMRIQVSDIDQCYTVAHIVVEEIVHCGVIARACENV